MSEQPLPVKNTYPCVQDQVIADIQKRKEIGIQRYGTVLQLFNGRDAIRDAYEESLDQTIYLRQALDELNGMRAERDEARAVASVLIHAYDNDNRPPAYIIELARSYGNTGGR